MPPLPLKGSPDNNNDDEQHNNNNQNHNKDQAIRNKPVLSEMIKSGLTGCEMSPKRNKPINSSESAINNNSPGRLKIYRGELLLHLGQCRFVTGGQEQLENVVAKYEKASNDCDTVGRAVTFRILIFIKQIVC